MDLDSSWKVVFEKATDKSLSLKRDKLPLITPDSISIKYANKDSMSLYSPKMTFTEFKKMFGTEVHIELSSILLFKNKAIVEMNNATGNFGGEDMLYFLERKKRKWVVVSYLPIWD